MSVQEEWEERVRAAVRQGLLESGSAADLDEAVRLARVLLDDWAFAKEPSAALLRASAS